MQSIPKIYDIWLMDNYKKDSLDIRNNSTYKFDITADKNSYGNNRFSIVVRQNPALAVHLLNFTATKAPAGSEVVWVTENEENYTYFTVERSIDGGLTFNVLGGPPSSAQGTYSFLDKNPVDGADTYRLRVEDLNGTITYSNAVTLMYGNAKSLVKTGISVYPNPAKNTVNLTIATEFNPGISTVSISKRPPGVSYDIQIADICRVRAKKATINQQSWQTDVRALMPGTYVISVIDKNNHSVVGKETFIKL